MKLFNNTMKKIISIILILCVCFSMAIYANADNLTNQKIQIGDYLVLGNYGGEAIVWRCVAIDDNGPLMLSDKVLSFKAFDAPGEYGEYHRDKEGSNNWETSCLRYWLNSYGDVDWKNRISVPSIDNVFEGVNDYDKEEGFLTSFTSNEQKLIKTVDLNTYLNSLDSAEADGGNAEFNWSAGSYDNFANNAGTFSEQYWHQTTTDKVFVLDSEQLKAVYDNLGEEYLAATATEYACETDHSGTEHTGEYCKYWLRIPSNTGMSYEVQAIADGNNGVNTVSVYSVLYGDNYQNVGVRPAFYLDEEAYADWDTIDITKGRFTLGRDNNSFLHCMNTDTESGFYEVYDYNISTRYFNKLVQYSDEQEIDKIKNVMNSNWGGSCYGIASTMGLVYKDVLSVKEITDKKAEDYYSLPKPCSDRNKLLNIINYYQLSQFLEAGSVNRAAVSYSYNSVMFSDLVNFFYGYDSLEKTLENLVEYIKNNGVCVLVYFKGAGGHAILATDYYYDSVNNCHKIKLYDENSVNLIDTKGSFKYMTISEDYKKFSFPLDNDEINEENYSILYFCDSDSLPKLSVYEEDKNDFIGAEIIDKQNKYSEISFKMGEAFKISNSKGQSLIYDGKAFSGDMSIYSLGVSDFGKISVITEFSNSFFIEDVTDVDIEVINENAYKAIKGTNIDRIEMNVTGDVSVFGKNPRARIFTSTNNNVSEAETELISIYGEADANINLNVCEDLIQVSSDGKLDGINTISYIGSYTIEDSYEVSGNDVLVKYITDFKPGDVDADGNINATDALKILKHAAKISSIEKQYLADVNDDNWVNASDALQILKYAAKLIEYLDD